MKLVTEVHDGGQILRLAFINFAIEVVPTIPLQSKDTVGPVLGILSSRLAVRSFIVKAGKAPQQPVATTAGVRRGSSFGTSYFSAHQEYPSKRPRQLCHV